MLTLGYITKLNEADDNLFEVRIPLFEKAGSSKNLPDLSGSYFKANLNQIPGQYNAYRVGDCVVIGFLDNKLERPIILGKLFVNDNSEARGASNADSIKVASKAALPKDTTIGDITYDNLVAMARATDLFTNQIDTILSENED